METGEDGSSIIADADGLGCQIAVNEPVVFPTCRVHFGKGMDGFASEVYTLCSRPRRVLGPLLETRRGGVNNCEETHFTWVARRVLKGVKDARRPPVWLQGMNRLELAPRFAFGVPLVRRREIIDVENNAVLLDGAAALIDAMEAFFF